MLKLVTSIYVRAALIGAALLCVRLISKDFAPGTTTAQHPYILFVAALMIAGCIWVSFIPLIKRAPGVKNSKRFLLIIFAIGLGFRALFFGSTPIYEDDWNRYLWDGYVATQGVNPYLYAPDDILAAPANAQNNLSKQDDLSKLSALSRENDNFASRINSGEYTTIYPPIAVAVFAGGALIGPLNLDVLRVLFWLSEALTLFLMVKALTAFGRSPLWMALYALNPLVIYAGINAAHMDVLLLPFLLACLITIKTRPFLAAAALSCAAAVKIWPLLLAPVLFRSWLGRPKIYIAAAMMVAGLSLLLLLPLLLALGGASGTSAYAASWQRSTYLFPLIDQAIGTLTGHWSTPARLTIAAACTGLSLWLGFKPLLTRRNNGTLMHALPLHLLLLTLIFFLLSPTGFPWYLIWVCAFFPFAPYYSVAALTVLLPIYYLRYAIGEQYDYLLYTDWLVPLQFSIPIGLLLLELSRGYWKDTYDTARP